jgi:ADP-ribose pyrophosphatase YjhB (NUDIX family)
MSLIRCYDDAGQAHPVAAEALQFSPAVYGIFIENNARVLLLSQPRSALYAPPGLLLAKDEQPTQAIRHYFRRLAGISPILGSLLLVEEQYRWLDGQGWRVAALYYGIKRPFSASIHLQPDTATGTVPEWVDLAALQRQQFQFGYKAIMAGIAQTHS